MNPKAETSKQELILFFVIAFAVPYLMGIPLAISQRAGNDTSVFANAQMFYPAAGVMAAYLLAHRKGLPIRFYVLHLLSTVVCVVMSLLSVVQPGENWLIIINLVLIAASVLGWILLLTEKKRKRESYGLRWKGKVRTALWICLLFVALKTVMAFVSAALSGADYWFVYLTYWKSVIPWVNLVILIPNFFLSFLPFFGEEYGWRYYLTPILQKRFGPRRGVLLLGVLWGLWHLPLNLFFYSPETSLQSLTAQIIVCITLGIFFTFGYEVSGHNIWVPVLLHYLNNNMILVWAGTAEISNQVYTWGDILLSAVLYGVLFLPFLSSRVFKEKTQPAIGPE